MKNILIVEDTMSTAESLKSLFEQNNYKAHIVDSAEEAIDVLKHFRFNVIVSDVNLKEKDGFQLSREIREKDQETPIILYTSMFDQTEDFEVIAKRIGVKFIPNMDIKRALNGMMSKLNETLDRHDQAVNKFVQA